MRHGFSLLELSIVLVIIGLLAGGVMTGQSLIRGAELRAVITEYTRFQTASNGFRDKYQAVPGDMKNATAFWGKDNTNCAANTGTAATPGTCNGDGDGKVYGAAGAAATGEIFQFWKHLALAGLVEGNYTGLSGPNTGYEDVLGVNSPNSKVTNAGWAVYTLDSFAGDLGAYKYDYGNALIYGGQYTGNSPMNPILKPEEAWNIDTKLDDGKPGQGRVIARNWNNACATSSSNSDYTGSYKLTDSSLQCAFYFAKAF